MADIEKTGASFRVLASLDPVTWNKVSFWSRSIDTIFEDGKTAEQKVGAINGITSDVASVSKSVSASSYLVNQISGELAEITLPAVNWSENSTKHSNGKSYFHQTVFVKNILLAHPMMYLATDRIPTDEERDVWNSLEMEATISGSEYVLTFYIESTPEIDISVGIKGVELL